MIQLTQETLDYLIAETIASMEPEPAIDNAPAYAGLDPIGPHVFQPYFGPAARLFAEQGLLCAYNGCGASKQSTSHV